MKRIDIFTFIYALFFSVLFYFIGFMMNPEKGIKGFDFVIVGFVTGFLLAVIYPTVKFSGVFKVFKRFDVNANDKSED